MITSPSWPSVTAAGRRQLGSGNRRRFIILIKNLVSWLGAQTIQVVQVVQKLVKATILINSKIKSTTTKELDLSVS